MYEIPIDYRGMKMLTFLYTRVLRRKVCNIVRANLVSEECYSAERFAACLQNSGDMLSLRKLHACIFTHGFADNIYLGSKLLNCYANFGGLVESRWVFERIINRNLSLWNSAIVGYFRAGHFEEVLWLYSRLKLLGIGLDSSAITFGLKSCTELGRIAFGGKVHADTVKVCLNRDRFVGSSLIGMYSGCGSIDDTEKAFEEILDKDIVAYTSMVTAYAQSSNGYAHKAFEIARDMHRERLNANRVTLISLLQAAAQLEALKEGRSIHCYAIRRGIGLLDEVFETSLVDMYARSCAPAAAASMLRQTEGTVASWNAMIAGLVRSGHSSEALGYFHLMLQVENISPDSITIANVLSACSDISRAHEVKNIHGFLVRKEIPLDIIVATALIDLYSGDGKVKNARELFNLLGMRDSVLYNVMISGYLQNEIVDDGIKMFRQMVNSGFWPNFVTMMSLLSGFAKLADIRRGRWMHGLVVRYGFHSNVDVSNQILDMYAKCGCLDIAKKVFNSMIQKDPVSWTAMMMGYVNHGHADEALELFQLMRETREKPDSVTIIILLQALSQLSLLEQVKQIHGHVYRILFERDTATVNSMISAYAKCGGLDISEALFKSMVEHELSSWNTIIAAFGMHGNCRTVLELFHQMQRDKVMPDGLTFTSVLSACSHAGLVEEAWHVFHSMETEYSIIPQEEHFSCMVDLLGRAGQLEKAYELLKCLPSRNKSNALCALLAACRTHRNTTLGELIGREFLELEPQNSSTYSLVSNMYAQAGKWREAASLRTSARERGLKRIPGYSIIESDEHASRILSV